MNTEINILIVDDEEDIRSLLTGILEDEGYVCRQAKNDDETFNTIKEQQPTLILLDVWLENSKLDGIGILKEVLNNYPDIPIVMMSGHSTIETAVGAIKLGAYDFIEKPFDVDSILLTISRALEVSALKQENKELKAKACNKTTSEIHGHSQQISMIRNIILKVSPTESRVFIKGAQGTGKTVAARMIHKNSNRADAEFVSINCAAIDSNKIELKLFGSKNSSGNIEKGAFEKATGGTLLLDEISVLPINIQAKLVQVLQENSFCRIGCSKPIELNVRLIATSSKKIEELIVKEKFREDLYYRLNIVSIDIPAIKERKDDIEILAKYFLSLEDIFEEHNIVPLGKLILLDDALAAMRSYSWPGNVRQIKNAMEWLIIMYGQQKPNSDGNIAIDAKMLPPDLRQLPEDIVKTDPVIEMMTKPLKEARTIFEKRYILAQIKRFDGNISKTASFIGMERSALHRKLKTLLIDGERDIVNNKKLAK